MYCERLNENESKRQMKMEKTKANKLWAMWRFAACLWLCTGCTQNSFWAEDGYWRSWEGVAKGVPEGGAYGLDMAEKIAPGRCSGKSLGEVCDVHVTWTEGFLASFPAAALGADATVHLRDGVVTGIHAYWSGRDICGIIYYRYTKDMSDAGPGESRPDSLRSNGVGVERFRLTPTLTNY